MGNLWKFVFTLTLNMNYRKLSTNFTTNYSLSNLWAIYGNSCFFDLEHELSLIIHEFGHELNL